MDYFSRPEYHHLAASAPPRQLIEAAAKAKASASSAEWWTQPPRPSEYQTPSTPPTNELTFDGLSSDDQLPSSPAAMFLSGFGFLTPVDEMAANSRSSSLPQHAPTPTRPSLSRLSIASSAGAGDASGCIVAGYKLGSVIGHGAFSTVRRATAISSSPYSTSASETVAVKIVRRNDPRPGASEARLRLVNEAKIWSQLSHEHVLPLFKTEESPEATYLFTLYCPAGTLLDVINQHKADGLEGVGMDDAGMLFRQIVRGLKYLHEVVRLVHCDIKLENVLVDDQGSCRIADFGLSKWIGDDPNHNNVHDGEDGSLQPQPHNPNISVHLSLLRSRGRHKRPLNAPFSRHPAKSHTASESSGSAHPRQQQAAPTPLAQHWFAPGSLPYASPELLAPHLAPLPPHPAQDIWALGCVLYALLFGKLPFSDPFEPRLQMKIVRGIWKLPSNCRPRNGLSSSRTRRSTSRGPRGRSRSGSRSRAPIAASKFTSRRPGEAGKTPGSAVKSPTSATFVSNVPPPHLNQRMRSKSRGRTMPNSGRGRGRSLTPPLGTVPKTIGKVAENVLHGCLCVDLPNRWTVSMIDEVGWGVGWDLDVDEAGEEVVGENEAEDSSTSGSGSTASSSLKTNASADAHEDESGNRYYVTPTHSPAQSRRSSTLFVTTLQMVSSPVEPRRALQTVIEAAFGSSSEDVDKVKVESSGKEDSPSVNVKETGRDLEDSKENSTGREKERKRGKRGQSSRSSSRRGVHLPLSETTSITPPSDPSSIASSPGPSPGPSHEVDPFWIFRQGHVPSSLAQSFYKPSSRTASSSRPDSRVHSRASSFERDTPIPKDPWARGRTSNHPSADFRRTQPMTESASCPLPRPPSSDREIWRPIEKLHSGPTPNHSVSPSPSPSPSTPMDGSVIINKDAILATSRSPSRGRGRGPFPLTHGHGVGGREDVARLHSHGHGFRSQHGSPKQPSSLSPGRDVLSSAPADANSNRERYEAKFWPWS